MKLLKLAADAAAPVDTRLPWRAERGVGPRRHKLNCPSRSGKIDAGLVLRHLEKRSQQQNGCGCIHDIFTASSRVSNGSQQETDNARSLSVILSPVLDKRFEFFEQSVHWVLK